MFQKIFRDVSHGLGHFSPMFHIISYIYIAIVACSYVEKRVTSVELYIFSNSIVITIETTNFVLIHVISMVVWRKFGYLTPYSPVANCSPSPPQLHFFGNLPPNFLTIPTPPNYNYGKQNLIFPNPYQFFKVRAHFYIFLTVFVIFSPPPNYSPPP